MTSNTKMMTSVYMYFAISVGLLAIGVEADLNDIDFAFGRPISTGARRKRLPGSQLKAGSGLLTIEELEKEFEAVSFGDLFFDRVLEESSMSYSMSYKFSDYSLSYSYSSGKDSRTIDDAPPPSVEDTTSTPAEDDVPEPPAPVPAQSPDETALVPELSMNRFACDAGGEIALEEDVSPDPGATSVNIEYSYSFEASVNDPNTVFLIEAAIVGTIVSTLLDCNVPSDGDGRALAPATSVSTTFSTVSSTDPCAPSEDGSSCYIIDSSIEIQLQDGPSAEEARVDALRAVKKAMDDGEYTVPAVTDITYLGPDVGSADSSQLSVSTNPESVEDAPTSDQQDDDGLSPMTKTGIVLMSVGGVVLIAALLRRRSLRARRNNEHVRLKDDGSRDESSLLTIENSQDSPTSTPSRNQLVGAFPAQLEHDIA